MATLTINSEIYINLPPDVVGDKEVTRPNRSTTTIRDTDFLGTTPAYHDPEGDGIENVKIETIPSVGHLTLDGATLTGTTVVTLAQLLNNELVYHSPDQDAGAIGVFTFSISDTGSGNYTY